MTSHFIKVGHLTDVSVTVKWTVKREDIILDLQLSVHRDLIPLWCTNVIRLHFLKLESDLFSIMSAETLIKGLTNVFCAERASQRQMWIFCWFSLCACDSASPQTSVFAGPAHGNREPGGACSHQTSTLSRKSDVCLEQRQKDEQSCTLNQTDAFCLCHKGLHPTEFLFCQVVHVSHNRVEINSRAVWVLQSETPG